MATASSGSSHFDVTQNQKRWLVVGIALNKILIPQIRPFVEQGINTEYNNLKTSHNIHGQSTSGRLQRWPPRKVLKYENINGNNVHPRLSGGRFDYSLFDCRVMSHVDFARLYVENYMAHFTAFDDHCDASAVLTLLGGVPAFSAPVQTAAADVRIGRNDWAHCVFRKWDQVKYQQSFIDMEHLVKVLALPAADEGKILGELKDWEIKGTHLCMNSPLDPALLQLVQQELKSLQDDVKNMSIELEDEKRKVQDELKKVATTLEEVEQRVQILETGQQTLEHRSGLFEDRMDNFEGVVNQRIEKLENSKQSTEDKVHHLQEQMEDLALSTKFDETATCQDNPIPTACPKKLVELIKRDYKGAVVCPFPWCEDELQFELSNIFTRLVIMSKEKQRARKTDNIVSMTDVFAPHEECGKPRVVLIEGQPGMGKTTYCQKLAYDWSVAGIAPEASFPKVEILLLLKCRDMTTANIEEAINDQLLPHDADKKEKENFFEFIHRNQSKILLVLDGLDELRHDLLQDFLPLIKGKVFSNIYLMLTARNEAGTEVRRYCDTLLDIVGYTSRDTDSYITKYFSNHEDPGLGNALIEKLKHDDQLRELTANPLNTALLCLVCEDTKGAFPSNKTKLYSDLVSCALRRDFAKKNKSVPSDPIETCADQLNKLGKMTLEALKDDRMLFSEDELKFHSINFMKCFLSREASVSKIRPTACYSFTHKTFQEFFAAFYLEHEMIASDKPRRDALLAQLSPVDKYWQVWEFLFTMVVSKSHDDAIYLLSRLCACLYHKKAEKLIEAESNANLTVHVCKHTCYNWVADIERLSKEEELVQSLLIKALDLIAECESDENELKDYQKKMVLILARCFPVRKFGLEVKLGDSPVVSEFLKVNCTLTHLHLDSNLDEGGLATIKFVLQSDHKLVYLSLTVHIHDEFSFLMDPDAHPLCDIHKMRLPKVEALAEFLQGNRALTHLNISWVGIPYPCTLVLARAFQFNRTLTHLCLDSTLIDSAGAEVLAEALRSNCSLTHLSLPRNSVADRGAVAFAKVLLLDCGLLYLDLSDNCISDGGVTALAQALEQGPGLPSNATLTYLDLSQLWWNVTGWRLQDGGMIGESGASALARALQTNCSLTYLNLCYNAIGETGAAAIGEALQSNCNLTHLYLNNNQIGARGAEALAKALRPERTFTQLNQLERSSIDDSGVAELHFALVKAIHGPCSTKITCLELQYNNISCSGATALADALLSNSTLERLNLSSNKIACSGAEALAKALQSNKTLTHLYLKFNEIRDSGATEFAEALNKNYTLTYLDLSSNPIGELGAQSLARVDQSTCKLKYDERYSEK